MIPQTSNLLAIEWDRREVRYVWGSVSGKRLLVRALGRMNASDGEETSDVEFAETLLEEIRSRLRLRNPKVVFVLPRGECEEFEAGLPPANENEVAQFVINQAHERWPSMSADAAIDYYALENSLEGTPRVSIMLLTSDRKRHYESLCKPAGWRLHGIRIRHLGAVQLLRRLADLEQKTQTVLVSLSGSDAELVVFSHARISLVRTIPLSPDVEPSVMAEKLKLEIQRSLLVTTNPRVGETEEETEVYLFGSDDELGALARELREAMSSPVTLLDPLKQLTLSTGEVPQQIHQFAPLLGVLTDANKMETVDFLKPKCAVSNLPLYRRLAIYAASLLVLISILVWSGYDEIAQLRFKSGELGKELEKTQSRIDEMKKRMAIVDYYEEWQKDDINWLEELRELSSRFPDRTDAQVKSMNLSIGTNRRGVISMNLRARDDVVISRLEQAIRDPFHQIRTNQLTQNSNDAEYPWQFGASILVVRRTRDEFATGNDSPAGSVDKVGESSSEQETDKPVQDIPTGEEPSRGIDLRDSDLMFDSVNQPFAQ